MNKKRKVVIIPNAMRRALQELDESAEKVIVRLDSNVTTAEAWNINRDNITLGFERGTPGTLSLF